MTPADGEIILDILKARDQTWTIVKIASGSAFRVKNIAWGRDLSDLYDHITTNISPAPSDEHSVDFFYTNEVTELTCSDGKTVIWTRS